MAVSLFAIIFVLHRNDKILVAGKETKYVY